MFVKWVNKWIKGSDPVEDEILEILSKNMLKILNTIYILRSSLISNVQNMLKVLQTTVSAEQFYS